MYFPRHAEKDCVLIQDAFQLNGLTKLHEKQDGGKNDPGTEFFECNHVFILSELAARQRLVRGVTASSLAFNFIARESVVSPAPPLLHCNHAMA